ncbi:MAG: hypothetical protein J4F28_09335 [Nitrosopumilaceae archaeon]|nr:hypothetical protein [Nitrosopumilaceae archaeon]
MRRQKRGAKQGPDCIPVYGKRSWYQCSECGNVTNMQEHTCDDDNCKVHHPA